MNTHSAIEAPREPSEDKIIAYFEDEARPGASESNIQQTRFLQY